MSSSPDAIASHSVPDPSGDRPSGCTRCGGSLADAWTERALRSLAPLAEIGNEIAETLRPSTAPADGAEGTPAPVVRDPGLSYARVTRSVRLCWALGAQLIKGAEETRERTRTQATARAAQVADEAAVDRELRAEWRREDILDAVSEALAERETPEKEFDAVTGKLDEWLVEDERERKLSDMPLAQVVEMIYEDLEIPFEPKAWANETRTIEDAAAKRPVAPAAAPIPAAAPAPRAAPAEPGPPLIAAGRDPPSG